MDNTIFPTYRLIRNHDIAEIRQKISNQQNALFAKRSFKQDEVISDFSAGTIAAEPTYLTVQVGMAKHITLEPEFLQYINHSCEPNVFFNTTTMQVTALRAINEGEELCFFYPSTEWSMTQSFKCYCGSVHCIGEIKGAAYLSKDSLEKYKLTDFINQELVKRDSRQKVA